MNSIKVKINDLKTQLNLLIETNLIVKQENLTLKQEVIRLTKIIELENRSGASLGDIESTKVLHEKIDQCVAEINECIALLKNG
jgi:hypothetical protein